MSSTSLYREIYDIQQKFFELYISQFILEKNDSRFSNCRPSYINYMTDVSFLLYKKQLLYSILMIFFQHILQGKW